MFCAFRGFRVYACILLGGFGVFQGASTFGACVFCLKKGSFEGEVYLLFCEFWLFHVHCGWFSAGFRFL